MLKSSGDTSRPGWFTYRDCLCRLFWIEADPFDWIGRIGTDGIETPWPVKPSFRLRSFTVRIISREFANPAKEFSSEMVFRRVGTLRRVEWTSCSLFIDSLTLDMSCSTVRFWCSYKGAETSFARLYMLKLHIIASFSAKIGVASFNGCTRVLVRPKFKLFVIRIIAVFKR